MDRWNHSRVTISPSAMCCKHFRKKNGSIQQDQTRIFGIKFDLLQDFFCRNWQDNFRFIKKTSQRNQQQSLPYLLHPSDISPHSCTNNLCLPAGSPSTVPSNTHVDWLVWTIRITPLVLVPPTSICATAAPRL